MIFYIYIFFQFCNLLQNHPQENVTMFWIEAIYEGTKLLKYFYILARSLKIHYKIISFKKL